MLVYGKTDKGIMRSTNQDAFYIADDLDGGFSLAIVCDGMGGANAGNVASQCAVDTVSKYITNAFKADMDANRASRLINSALVSANMEIYDMSLKSPELSGMGTTAVVALAGPEYTVIAHIGDSRAYLIGDTAVQLTRDHSVVQSLIESGKLTPEEAKVHPRKNVITRALGTEEQVVPECSIIVFSKGQSLLLCTDGLTNFVETQEILKTFKENEISKVTEILTAKANEGGGGDNITVVTVSQSI